VPPSALIEGGTVTDAGFDSFRTARYCLLVTFRRSGAPVPTPVCFGVVDRTLYLRSEGELGKVKRMRNDPRVRVAPCNRRGEPVGPEIEAHARLIDDPGERRRAERAIQSNYGLLRLVYRTFAQLARVRAVYFALGSQPPAGTQDADA
jgi:PPOX class probable F420-dependent enzyme